MPLCYAIKNSVLALSSLIASFGLGEIALRALTPFPITETSNRVDDPALGYRISSRPNGIDEHGFRNEGKDSYSIAVLGDSHTYGFNVPSGRSWPARLESILDLPVYNFGIASYGIHSYHALLRTRVDTAAEGIIVGLYIANDLEVGYSFCAMEHETDPFWLAEVSRLGLEFPESASCDADDTATAPPRNSFEGFMDWLSQNVATASAFETLVLAKLRGRAEWDSAGHFLFPDSIEPMPEWLVRSHARTVDLDRPEVGVMFRNLSRFIDDWAAWSTETRVPIGVLLIPSRERVIFDYFDAEGRLDAVDPEFVALVSEQLEMEVRVAELLDVHRIPHETALDRTLTAFRAAHDRGRHLYPPEDGHPYGPGYLAYARAASMLWRTMTTAQTSRSQ